jgi:Flp pilus assembly protein protease CpaA
MDVNRVNLPLLCVPIVFCGGLARVAIGNFGAIDMKLLAIARGKPTFL